MYVFKIHYSKLTIAWKYCVYLVSNIQIAHMHGLQVNVGSLENVIRGYLKTAEDRTEAAREQSQQAVIDIDDLDNLATPESILLRCVTSLMYNTTS